MTLSYFRFKALLLRQTWLQPAYVGVDETGIIRYLAQEAPQTGISFEAVEGYALPGFQNAHSHAFQYAMAGLAESHPSGTRDDFWSWREAMYRCALSINPEHAEAVAAMVYTEMLKLGFTSVAEFHYLHHDKDGKPYSHLAEMGERMVAAAQASGIRITLIPVFYQKGNFGTDPFPHQRRFISADADRYFRLLEASKKVVSKAKGARLGFSVHSLRAVEFKEVLRTFNEGPKDLPFHLHVAEQKKEVEDCLAFCGKRPVQWLLDNMAVDERFHLVHSTHMDDKEVKALARSGAQVVLCPSTEGNLGDGIFRMKDYVNGGGRWSVGTDSHIGLDPMEEFRMIDYRQRLVSHRRNTFEGDAARYLINEEVESGRKAMGSNFTDHFSVGQPLDAVVYDASAPLISNTTLDYLVSTLVFSSDSRCRLGTIVGGQWVVKKFRHRNEGKISASFSEAMKALKNR